MEVTLEKIEIVKDRTGVDYKDAKDALEKADGSVVDAIINIEENIDGKEKKKIAEQSASIVENVKDLVKKGNVARIMVKNNDGETLLSLPINAGIVATVLAPWGVLAGVVSSFAFKCTVEVVKTDGSVIDVTDASKDALSKAKDKGGDVIVKGKDKAGDVIDKVKDSDIVDRIKESDALDKVKDRADDIRDFAEDKFDDIKDKASSLRNKDEDDIYAEFKADTSEAENVSEDAAEETEQEK